MYVRYTVHVQKGNKNIFKVVHVTSEGPLEFVEASNIHFAPKIKKNYDFQHFLLFRVCCERVHNTAVTPLTYDAADVLSLLLGAPENTSAASYVNSHSSRVHNRPGREDNPE